MQSKATQDVTNRVRPAFLDLRQCAAEFPLSRRKFHLLIKQNRLRAFRLDGKLILKRSDIEQLLTSTPIGANRNQLIDATLRVGE